MKLHILKLPYAVTLLFTALSFTNCSKDDDGIEPQTILEPEVETSILLNDEVNDFIWQGLNEIYLWQESVPNLSDTKFFTTAQYNTFKNTRNPSTLNSEVTNNYFAFLNGYADPKALFDDLLYQKGSIDKFSFLTEDYVALENSFQGISTWNGVDFQLVRLSGSDDIFGYVRYIANGSDAVNKDINRGDFFLSVDGQQLTIHNYERLLFDGGNNYTLGMAEITNGSITPNGKTVNLIKTEFTENPILISKVIDANGTKVGYLMYNSFTANFDGALNQTIGELKSQGISDLVLDLRYNPGGRVSSAIALASMITGQFTGQVFSKEIWNGKYQSYFESENPENLVNRFVDKLSDGSPLNHLNLNKLYVLTTTGSASASELVINGLKPYINVIQIGTKTTGKYTASITLYDSRNFGREGANPNHTYAIQPLVLKSANANGVTDYSNGLAPDYLITYQSTSGIREGENLSNMGVLGSDTEPFLAKALSLISGSSAKLEAIKSQEKPMELDVRAVADTKDFTPLRKDMFIDEIVLPLRN